MKAVLVRHTRPCNHEGLCYGRYEVKLAPTFEAEAAGVRRHLPWSPAVIWTSPAERCRRLAQFLARPGQDLHVDERLAEMHFGEWEGRPWESLRGPAVDAWMTDPWTARPPGGETAVEFTARVAGFRAELLANAAASQALIITHAGVIRAWRSVAEGRPLAELFREPVAYGGVYSA